MLSNGVSINQKQTVWIGLVKTAGPHRSELEFIQKMEGNISQKRTSTNVIRLFDVTWLELDCKEQEQGRGKKGMTQNFMWTTWESTLSLVNIASVWLLKKNTKESLTALKNSTDQTDHSWMPALHLKRTEKQNLLEPCTWRSSQSYLILSVLRSWPNAHHKIRKKHIWDMGGLTYDQGRQFI